MKEKPAPEDDEGETMADEEKEKATEGEEERDKDDAKVEEKVQPELLLLASTPKVWPFCFSPCMSFVVVSGQEILWTRFQWPACEITAISAGMLAPPTILAAFECCIFSYSPAW